MAQLYAKANCAPSLIKVIPAIAASLYRAMAHMDMSYTLAAVWVFLVSALWISVLASCSALD